MNPKHQTLALLAVLLATPLAQAQPAMKAGQYLYTVKAKMMGLSLPAVDFKQCVTQKDIDDGKAFVNTEKQADCSDTEVVWSGNRFNVVGRCKKPERSMTGTGTATAEDFELKMDVKMDGDMPMSSTQIVTAKRLGDC